MYLGHVIAVACGQWPEVGWQVVDWRARRALVGTAMTGGLAEIALNTSECLFQFGRPM